MSIAAEPTEGFPFQNRRGVAAYYCGVFGLIPGPGLLLGPTALTLGILALQDNVRLLNPRAVGYALAGIVLGAFSTLLHLAGMTLTLIALGAWFLRGAPFPL